MPVYLETRDVTADLEGLESVLIVTCPVCPPMSLSMQRRSAFVEPFRRGLKTGAFEDHVRSIRGPLERRGMRTATYSTHMPCMMMCLWTEGQRARLRKRARGFDGVLVMGCDSAMQTATETLEGCGCRVIQGMDTSGLVNATTTIRWPLTVRMDAHFDAKTELPTREAAA